MTATITSRALCEAPVCIFQSNFGNDKAAAASQYLSEQDLMSPGYEAVLSYINSFFHITQHLNETLSAVSIHIPQGKPVRNLKIELF